MPESERSPSPAASDPGLVPEGQGAPGRPRMTVEDTKRFPAAPSPDRASAGAVKKEDEAAAGDGGSANAAAAAAAAASLTFEAFAARNPLRAKQYINQLSEFTGELPSKAEPIPRRLANLAPFLLVVPGVHDQQLLVTALNKVKGPADFQDRLPGAIEWILENRHTYHNQQHQAQQQPSSPTGAPHQQQPFGPGGNFRKAPSPLGNSAAAQTMSPGELLRSKVRVGVINMFFPKGCLSVCDFVRKGKN